MTVLMNIPGHASIPDLLSAVAESNEFNAIKLRRGEKKVLNAINKSHTKGAVRYCVANPQKPAKPMDRISTGPEKIFILVSGFFLIQCSALH
jgi:hypothetical protein